MNDFLKLWGFGLFVVSEYHIMAGNMTTYVVIMNVLSVVAMVLSSFFDDFVFKKHS